MAATREDLVRIARDVVARTMDKHEYHGNPVTFDPHEWVLEAMRAAYDRGRRDGMDAHAAHELASRSYYPDPGTPETIDTSAKAKMDRQSYEEAHGIREPVR